MRDENLEKAENNILNENKKSERNIYVSVIAVLLLVIAGITIIQSKIEKNISVNGKKITDKKASENERCVYITGEIKNEGVVCVDKNDNISRAISKAGGVNKDADISLIDEKRKVVDGEKLHIISKENNTEILVNSNKQDRKSDGILSVNNISNKTNINTASKEELEKLEGIGASTANKIIEYRKGNRFDSIEDIKNVSGIGDAKYEKIKGSICVE